MEDKEMEAVIKQEGWTVNRLKRGKHTYIYAIRRDGYGFRKHRYIAPESKIGKMTREQIIAKLRAAS